MPSYNYECKKCDKIFEINHPITQDELKQCEVCGSDEFKIVIGNVNHQWTNKRWTGQE